MVRVEVFKEVSLDLLRSTLFIVDDFICSLLELYILDYKVDVTLVVFDNELDFLTIS